jgi:hypothetical protein
MAICNDPRSRQNLVLYTIDEISSLKEAPQVGSVLASAMDQLGFTALGINGLPPPSEGTDPLILTPERH